MPSFVSFHQLISTITTDFMLFLRVRIIKDKPSGAVTGWQERDGGSIKYSSQLPRETLISQYVGYSVHVVKGLKFRSSVH